MLAPARLAIIANRPEPVPISKTLEEPLLAFTLLTARSIPSRYAEQKKH